MNGNIDDAILRLYLDAFGPIRCGGLSDNRDTSSRHGMRTPHVN